MHQTEINEIAGTHLGRIGGYSDQYDPTLLVAVPRYLNREDYGIQEENLPFVGGDVWNCYEVSMLTEKGLPVNVVLKIYYSSDSRYHVESKSLKLYLNSFNMTKMGESTKESLSALENVVAVDLTRLLNTPVQVHAFSEGATGYYPLVDFTPLSTLINLDELEFTSYKSNSSELLVQTQVTRAQSIRIQSDLLRSNCRVTGQPDWGDVYIAMKGKNIPDLASLARYIVSHRQVNHFHEEVCEMMFVHLMEAYSPEKLMVACLYTRRGGIDINPIRATHSDLLPPHFINVQRLHNKTLRQ